MKLNLNHLMTSTVCSVSCICACINSNAYSKNQTDSTIYSVDSNLNPIKFNLATFASPNEALVEFGLLNRASASVFTSNISVGLMQLQSAIYPVSIYRLDRNKFRLSLLRAPIAGGSIMLPFMLLYGSSEFGSYEEKFGTIHLLPAYIFNPEFNLAPSEYFKVYVGYYFDLVQDARVRQIIATSIGIKLVAPQINKALKIGYENTKYRGTNTGSLIIGVEFE